MKFIFPVVACLLCAAGQLCFNSAGTVTWDTAAPVSAAEVQQPEPTMPPDSPRVSSGLQVLYDFGAADGAIVKDRANVGRPIHLKIADEKAVRRAAGSLEVRAQTVIQSDKSASRLIQSIRRTGEMTVEAWVRPANPKQSGPARIITLSKSSNERNLTLGQDGDKFDVRCRTTKTSTNGIPSVSSGDKSLAPKLTHVVYTRDRKGRVRIYLNGKRNVEKNVAGDTSNWDGAYQLTLANEAQGGRPWLGTYYLVAIYNRDLQPQEVQQNFNAGARVQSLLVQDEATQHAQQFNTQIAPLLARHCLECHDTVNNKGKLDLSRKTTAFAGGESGPVIVPGKANDSLLWEHVAADTMPDNRPPLSDREKAQLRDWIEAGAHWSLDVIDPAAFEHDGKVAQNWLRRLTVSEYIETVRSAVGVDIEADARKLLPPDLRADGFSNTAYNLNVDLKHIGAYSKLAEIIVSRMDVVNFAARFSKSRKLTDDSMRGLITEMGKWILRGPLAEHEVDVYRGISTTAAATGGDFPESVALILEAMLQSPRFLYRLENQVGDGTVWPVGEYELASRLSYIMWGAPPDAELMKLAESGSLFELNTLKQQVERMLQDPRAIQRSRQFISEWLNLARLDNLQPNTKKFPNWDPRLAGDMREETLTFFQEVAWTQKRPLADLLNAQVTFATPRLARHYGLQPQGKGLTRYDVTAVPGRGGLLTHGSVLTVGGDQASMVSRGLFVLHDLLRGAVKDPPPCVDTTPIPTKSGLTQRGIAESRIADANCGGCHIKFEPLAFGLEKFDGLGTFHEQDEHGNKLRDDGEILFPGTATSVPYQSSAELMNLLAGSDRVRECLTWKVAQFALGRPLTIVDKPILDEIHKTSQQAGGTYQSLITAIVLSDLVRMSPTEVSQENGN